MYKKSSLVAAVGFLTGLLLVTSAQAVPLAPPPAPPIITNNAPELSSKALQALPGDYSIGNPTPDEQLYLELINRARANPKAEGERWRDTTDARLRMAYSQFGVDLDLMAAQFATNYAILPPLAFNAKLSEAARLHTLDMFTNAFQGHVGSDGRSLVNRIVAQSYPYRALGENVYSYSEDVIYGHAGFEVDWGDGPGGMQDPPGHRNSIHSGAFREVGISVYYGSKTIVTTNGSVMSTNTVGPQLVTQDLGQANNSVVFITGVAYYDIDGSGFYHTNGSLANVSVAAGSPVIGTATTAQSGGYAIPTAQHTTVPVTFSGADLTTLQTNVQVSFYNVKVDYKLPYGRISGPNPAEVNKANVFALSPVRNATNYQVKLQFVTNSVAVDGAEKGLAGVIANVSSGYTVITTGSKASGTSSFHLAQPDGANQYLTLNRTFRAKTNSLLVFGYRLSNATSSQIAQAQISTNNGADWTTLWSKAGTGGLTATTFPRQTNAVSLVAGQLFQVRFAYEFKGGSLFSQTTSDVGFFIDDIGLLNSEELLPLSTLDSATPSFTFTPTNTGTFYAQVRAKVAGNFMPFGVIQSLTVSTLPPLVRIHQMRLVSPAQFQVDFQLQQGTATSYQLQSTTTLAGPWAAVTGATFSNSGGQLRFTGTYSAGPQRFYSIRIVQ